MEELFGNALLLWESVARAYPINPLDDPSASALPKLKTKLTFRQPALYEDDIELRKVDQQRMMAASDGLPNRHIHEGFMREAIAMVRSGCTDYVAGAPANHQLAGQLCPQK